jgi:CubicO group peptidase (beta-lactamase class C family)
MNGRQWSVAFVALLLVLGAALVYIAQSAGPPPVAAPTEAAAPDSPYDFTRLDRALEKMVSGPGVSGASMLIIKDGREVFQADYGDFTRETVVTIGSASKWPSVTTILMLIDKGQLGIDDKLSQYLPSFDTDDKRDITVRQALSHMTGIPSRNDCMRDYKGTIRACVETIAQLKLDAEPGTQFQYGSLSIQSLGRVAEVVTGKPFREYFQESLIAPLGLTRTRFGRYGKSANPGLAGNLNTTAEDFARFLQIELNYGELDGTRYLSYEMVKEMERGQTHMVPRTGHIPTRHTNTHHDLYGLGVWRDIEDANGDVSLMSCPGKFGFVPWIDRRHNLVGVLSTEFDFRVADQSKRPEPAAVIYLVCDIIDRATHPAMAKGEFNPRCMKYPPVEE